MAYTATSIFKSVWGNKRIVALSCTADATSGAFNTGLNRVEAAFISPVSMATSAILVRINKNSGTTALNGSIQISAAVSGDGFTVLAIGV